MLGTCNVRRSSRGKADRDERKHLLVLCTECIIHDSINERVDGTAEEPERRGHKENLTKKNMIKVSFQ